MPPALAHLSPAQGYAPTHLVATRGRSVGGAGNGNRFVGDTKGQKNRYSENIYIYWFIFPMKVGPGEDNLLCSWLLRNEMN